MRRVYTDEELRRILGADLPDSRLIEQKIQSAYDEIRDRAAGQRRGGRKRRKDGRLKRGLAWRRAAGGFGAAAAVLALAVLFCVADPSLAEELPIVGSIFGKLQGLFHYSGIPEEEIVSWQGEETQADRAEDGESSGTVDGQDTEGDDALRYQAADQGLTVTLMEYYASNQAVFVGMRIESETPFPAFAFMLAEPHRQILTVSTEERYSFRDAGDELVNGGRQIEGRLVDEYTFEGVMRIDYDSIKWDYRKYDQAYREGEAAAAVRGEPFAGIELTEENRADWLDEYEVPESFRMGLAIDRFEGYVQDGNYKVRGTWRFADDIEIRQSGKGASVLRIDEVNGEGWGLEYVELSPSELTVHVVCPEKEAAWPAVLDKDQRPLASGVNADQFSTYGHDISTVTVYVCDFETWTDIKSEAYRAGKEPGEMDEALYRRLLEERAKYKKVLCPQSP